MGTGERGRERLRLVQHHSGALTSGCDQERGSVTRPLHEGMESKGP